LKDILFRIACTENTAILYFVKQITIKI